MGDEDSIEIDLFEAGKWTTHRFPLWAARIMNQQLDQALSEREHPRPAEDPANRLKLSVE